MMLIYEQSTSSPKKPYNSVCMTDETNSIERRGATFVCNKYTDFFLQKRTLCWQMRTTQSMGTLMITCFFPFDLPANVANKSFAASSDVYMVSISMMTFLISSAASDLDRR